MFDLPPITHFRHAGTSEVASIEVATLFRLRGWARHAAFLGLCVGILDPQPNRIEDHYSIISSATASTPGGTPRRRGRFSLTSPARPRATLSRPPARDAVASATGLGPRQDALYPADCRGQPSRRRCLSLHPLEGRLGGHDRLQPRSDHPTK